MRTRHSIQLRHNIVQRPSAVYQTVYKLIRLRLRFETMEQCECRESASVFQRRGAATEKLQAAISSGYDDPVTECNV